MGLNDGLWLPGGLRMQSHIPRDRAGRNSCDMGAVYPGLSMGLLVATHYKDAESNLNKMFTEYDVYLVQDHIILRNVPQVTSFQGDAHGAEVTLNAADGPPDLSDPSAVEERIMSSSGDLVLIAWVDGQWPVIMGCVNHLRRSGSDAAPWYVATADGPRAAMHYNDVDVEIDKDSNVNVDMPDATDFTVNGDGNQLINASRAGGANHVNLGAGTEKLVLGESFSDDLRTFVNHVNTYATNIGVSQVPAVAAACTALSNACVAFMLILTNETDLSNVSKSE